MAKSRIKKSSIMFTDIVGYSKMVGKDENHALQLLDAHNQILTAAIDKFGGSVIKFIGDAVFAEFPQPQNAANCAIDIQINLIKRNKIHSKNDRIHIRIGLHMGDLVVKGDDLFGNTVNLGSRIEGVAPADGILISNPVYNAINREKSFFTKQLGFAKLKNIKDPCQLYKLYLNQLSFTGQSDEDLLRETLERGVKIVDMGTYSPIDVYSIGLMYFKNLGVAADEILCRGIAQDIVKDMGQINAFRMPSETEIDQYYGTDLPISEISRRMQAEYMLLGSIMKKGEEFTLNLEMKDMNSGSSCFEDTFIFKSTEINIAKGEILLKVLSHFNLELPEHVKKYFETQPTSNPEAMEHYVEARHIMRFIKSHDHLQEARDHLESAIKLDPAFLYAHANKGYNSYLQCEYDLAEEELDLAMDLAEQDNIEASNAYVYLYMGMLNNKLEKYNKSIHYSQLALDIYLKHDYRKEIAAVLHNMGAAIHNSGNSEEALDCFNRSIRIKEEFEDRRVLASGYNQIANVYFTIGDYSLAIDNARRALGYFQSMGNSYFGAFSMIVMADSFAQTGIFSESVKYLKLAQEILEEFNNLFLLGKVDVLFGIKYFNEGNYEKSVSYYEEGIDKMQLDESREWVLKYSIELSQVLIYCEKWEKALKIIQRCRTMHKKIADSNSEDRALLDAMGIYIQSCQNHGDPNQLAEMITGFQEQEINTCFSWYYLGKACINSDMISESEHCLKESDKLLKKQKIIISNPDHQKTYQENYILHQEIQNLSKSLIL